MWVKLNRDELATVYGALNGVDQEYGLRVGDKPTEHPLGSPEHIKAYNEALRRGDQLLLRFCILAEHHGCLD